MPGPNEVDFVIVGGGLAGLSAALIIRDANLLRAPDDQLEYVVLESSDRLGGRTYSPNPALDFGGGYIGITQTYVQYLIRRFAAEGVNIPTTPQYLPHDGCWLYESTPGRAPDRYPGDNPLMFPGGSNALQILGQLDDYALLLRTNLERPWESPLATQLDGMTVQDWIDQQTTLYVANPQAGMSPDTKAAFIASVRSAFSLEPKEVSFFFLLYYSATAGSYADIVDVAGGDGAAEATRFLFGTRSLIDALANEIGSGNIALNAKVESIEDADAGLTVTTTNQSIWHARKKVIVAMSPPISSGIQYTPALGPDRVDLCKRMADCRGRTIKGFVRFKDAYWRDPNRDPMRNQRAGGGQIRQGFMLSVANLVNDNFHDYPLDWTLDNVWENQQRNSPDGGPKQCYMMTFIVADSAAYWAPKPFTDRANAVIQHVLNIYGLTNADLYNETEIVSNYSEVNWPLNGPSSNTAVGGLIPAPDAMMGPNTLSQVGWALRVPNGNIHWAGSESATEWCGYMDGAIQSGFRAAGEVLGMVQPLSAPALRPPKALAPQAAGRNPANAAPKAARSASAPHRKAGK